METNKEVDGKNAKIEQALGGLRSSIINLDNTVNVIKDGDILLKDKSNSEMEIRPLSLLIANLPNELNEIAEEVNNQVKQLKEMLF